MIEYLQHAPVASFIFALTIGTSIYAFSNHQLLAKFMLQPYAIRRGQGYYTVLTSGLVHRDWGHLLFNMLTFYFFGFTLEIMLAGISAWGHVHFALIYVLGLVLSDITTLIKQKDNPLYRSLGASGAICAVLFSYIMFQPKSMLGIFMIIPMPAWLFGILFLVYCAWAAKQAKDSINHDAHFYGAIVGVVVTLLIHPFVFQHFLGQFL